VTDPSSGSWPPPVAAWFDAHLRHDAEGELAQMSDDVVVVDDGRTYEGAPAVRECASRATGEYTYTTTLLAAAADGARTALTVRLDGNFRAARCN
jgi:hypothetical protein